MLFLREARNHASKVKDPLGSVLKVRSVGRRATFVKLQVLGLRLGVDFTFALDNNNDNNNNDNDNNNPHLNFFKGTVLGVKEQGLGIRDKR